MTEEEFQKGIKSTDWYKEYVKEFGEPPDLDTPIYDYREAWRQGVRPERDPHDNNRHHWPSEYKSEDHPTYWKGIYSEATRMNPDSNKVTKKKRGNWLRGMRKKYSNPTRKANFKK